MFQVTKPAVSQQDEIHKRYTVLSELGVEREVHYSTVGIEEFAQAATYSTLSKK